MYQIRHLPLLKPLTLLVAVLLVFPYGFSSSVHGQTFAEITSAAVLPIQNATGVESLVVAEKATDAVALALEDSGEFRVISRGDLKSALAGLGLAPPLMEPQQVRLGEDLRVDKVISGVIHRLAVDGRTGQCRVKLEIKAMDVRLEAILDGALVEIETRPIPGWQGEDATVANEALRLAAERAVNEMLRRHVRPGRIFQVDEFGTILLSIGKNQGVYEGQRMLVVRPGWNPDLEITEIRRVGEIQVYEARARTAKANAVGEDLWPRTSDQVYALYTPSEIIRATEHKHHITKSLRLGWAFAMLAGVLAIGFSKGTTAPPGADVQIGQEGAGGTPYIRVNTDRGFIPETSQVHAWLFYRDEMEPLTEPDNIVGATSQARLDMYADAPAARLGVAFTTTFTYLDRSGEQADGSVDLTYDDPALTAGSHYYYKVQRVVDPIMPQPPLAGQVGAAQATLTVDPPEALGEASRAVGPVTYFEPAVLVSPANNSETVNPADVTFEWTPSDGADQYQVRVYGDMNLSNLVYQSPVLSWTGGSVMTHRVTSTVFAGNTTYWWVACNCKSGEAQPIARIAGQDRFGWIYSDKWSFTTTAGPPPPPSAAGSDRPSKPTSRSGFWHERGTGFGGSRR